MALNTVIIGMGPGGLIAGYILALHGHKITLIEAREHYMERDNRIVTNGFLLDFLFKISDYAKAGFRLIQGNIYLSDLSTRLIPPYNSRKFTICSTDKNFFDHILAHTGVIEINAIQQYLMAKLKSLAAKKEIIFLEGTKALNIDCEKSIINLHDQQGYAEIQFENLILAEGSKRQLTKQVFPQAKYTQLPAGRLRQNNYCMVKINMAELSESLKHAIQKRSIIGPVLFGSSHSSPRSIDTYKMFGWQHHSLPLAYIQYLEKTNQFYIVGEIPDRYSNLSEAELKKALLSWSRIILTDEHPIVSLESIREVAS